MPSKVTMIFEGSTFSGAAAQRIAGWSESWYSDQDAESGGLRGDLNILCGARVLMLPAAAAIVAQRIQKVDARGIAGQSKLQELYFPGTYGTNDGDLPSMALCWYARGDGKPNHKMVMLRGCPDSIADRGEYKKTPAFQSAVDAYFGLLLAKWRFKVSDRTIKPTKLVSIDGGGVFETEDPHGLAVDDYVRLLRCYTDEGHSVRGLFRVSAAAARTGTLKAYAANGGLPVARGKIRKDVIDYAAPFVDGAELKFPELINRKVGLPFHRFRGRRSAKS